MSVDPKVMETIRKVLALAMRGGTPGEMEAAMGRAKAIAMRHGLDLAALQASNVGEDSGKAKGVEVTNDSTLTLGVAFWRKYHNWVCHVVQEVFGVRFVTNRYKDGSRTRCSRIYIIGEPTDVEIAKVMFTWLEELYPKSYLLAAKQGKCQNNAAAQHGYYRGLTWGLLEVNKREEQKVAASTEGQQWAMVVRSKETAIAEKMKADFPDLKQSKARSVNVDMNAVSHGYEKGKSINLKQVKGGTGNPALN